MLDLLAYNFDLSRCVRLAHLFGVKISHCRFALLISISLALVAAEISAAPQATQAPQKVASVEGVPEYKLANGARVLLFPESSKPTITVNMTVLVGSRHEGYGEAGTAHLLEHMVFKGTPTFQDIPTALRDHGASFNGTTNRDRTNYYETLPANDEPKRMEIPAVDSIAAMVKDYRGGTAMTGGEEFDPSPENLNARVNSIDMDGLKVGMLSKKNRGGHDSSNVAQWH